MAFWPCKGSKPLEPAHRRRLHAKVAQQVELRFKEPLVVGSIPTHSTGLLIRKMQRLALVKNENGIPYSVGRQSSQGGLC